MFIDNYDMPVPSAEEILIKVHAFGLNRADLLQRRGLYPPPIGESNILGLEVAGEVVAVGDHVSRFAAGDRVCALVGGGAYATHCVAHRDLTMAIDEKMEYTEAAAIPEAYLTAWQAVSWLAQLKPGEKILIHAGASSIGLAAIQISKMMGAHVGVTASSGKLHLCRTTGAELCIDYKNQDFEETIKKEWQETNVIIDVIGGPYLTKNLNCISLDGRIVVLGLMGGLHSDINLGILLRKRIHLMGSTLRARSPEYKGMLTKDLASKVLPYIKDGTIKPVIDSILPWTDIQAAHSRMEQNLNAGKIVMTISE